MGIQKNNSSLWNDPFKLLLCVLLVPLALPAIFIIIGVLYWIGTPLYDQYVLIPSIKKDAKEYIHETYNCPYDKIVVRDAQKEVSSYWDSRPRSALVICDETAYSIYYDRDLGWLLEDADRETMLQEKWAKEYKNQSDSIYKQIDRITKGYTNNYFLKDIIRSDNGSNDTVKNFQFVIFIDVDEYRNEDIITLLNRLTEDLDKYARNYNENSDGYEWILYSIYLINNHDTFNTIKQAEWNYDPDNNPVGAYPDNVMEPYGYITTRLFFGAGNVYDFEQLKGILGSCQTNGRYKEPYDNMLIEYKNSDYLIDNEKNVALYSLVTSNGYTEKKAAEYLKERNETVELIEKDIIKNQINYKVLDDSTYEEKEYDLRAHKYVYILNYTDLMNKKDGFDTLSYILDSLYLLNVDNSSFVVYVVVGNKLYNDLSSYKYTEKQFDDIFSDKTNILKVTNNNYDVIDDENTEGSYDIVFNNYVDKYKNKKLKYDSILYVFDRTSTVYGYGIKK